MAGGVLVGLRGWEGPQAKATTEDRHKPGRAVSIRRRACPCEQLPVSVDWERRRAFRGDMESACTACRPAQQARRAVLKMSWTGHRCSLEAIPIIPLRCLCAIVSTGDPCRRLQNPMLRLARVARLFAPGNSLVMPHTLSVHVHAMRGASSTSGDNLAASGGAPLPAAGTVAAAAQQQQALPPQQQQQQGRVRDYPDEPRVGVGVVVLRQLPPAGQPEVLLIRRAKEPAKGAAGCLMPATCALLPPHWWGH